VVSLEISDEERLKQLYEKLVWRGADVTQFREPDIGGQLTSICYVAPPEILKITNKLNLTFKNLNNGKQMVNV
jgi:hypothetical protein